MGKAGPSPALGDTMRNGYGGLEEGVIKREHGWYQVAGNVEFIV